MGDIAERLTYYKTKCSEHLNRVRLAHLLALKTLEGKQFLSDEHFKDIISASFTDLKQDNNLGKMRMDLHKQHLLSLKINFELFLNLLLSTVFEFRFKDLADKIPGQVQLKELSVLFADTGESRVDWQKFIINKAVWNYGLVQSEVVLKSATEIQLRDALKTKDFDYWPQIRTAFEARHLVEHRNGKVDAKFRSAVVPFWRNSSWGRRLRLDDIDKVVVEEEDVIATHDAMLHATELLTNAVQNWSSHSDAGQKAARNRKLRAVSQQAAETRLIHWVESDIRESDLGHGVLFMPDELHNNYVVAFLEGFDWLHRPGSAATVRLLGTCPSDITADHWSKIIKSTREAVLSFLSDQSNFKKHLLRHGNIFRRGPFRIIVNA